MAENTKKSSRVYTIPLGKAWISPRHRRAVRVVHMIQEFAKKHMKSDTVRLSTDVNEYVWKRGAVSPPRRITVEITKDGEGKLIVSLPKSISTETLSGELTSKENLEKPINDEVREEKVEATEPPENLPLENSTSVDTKISSETTS